MTILVFSLVLLAAALHAIWNAVIKGTGDKTIAIGLVALGHMVLGLIGAAFFPLPDIKIIPFIIASTIIHWGCLLYTSPSPRDATLSRMPSSA